MRNELLPKQQYFNFEERVLSDQQYDFFREFIATKTGIALGEGKHSLIENRLNSRLRLLGIDSYSDYIRILKIPNSPEIAAFIDVLTTHTTHFFRENKHFQILKKVVCDDLSRKRQRITVWCAACSTGEEVFTIAIVLEDMRLTIPDFDYRILATDISEQSIEQAGEGVYDKNAVADLDPGLLRKYFQRNSTGEKFRVKNVIRNKVKFRIHNLAEIHERPPMAFDVIFLRNVLIYFPENVIKIVARKMHAGLNVGGYLFIGHSETIGSSESLFENTDVSVYKKAT